MEYIAIGIVSLFTSTIGSVAGGGGGLIVGPAMLLLGFSPNTVVATQKAGGMGVNIGAFSKFLKHKDTIQWKWGAILAVISVISSYIGTRLVFSFSENDIQNVIAIIVLAIVPVSYFRRKDGLKARVTNKLQKTIGVMIYSSILTIQAGFGGGVGVINMYVLMGPMGFTAIQANATKRLVGVVLTTASMGFFIGSGYVNWLLAAVSLVTTLIGGYFGASIAMEKGSEFVKDLLLVISIVMAIALLLN